jgi:ABC-type Fe2+-enterobactin transport system substrate-binding protein
MAQTLAEFRNYVVSSGVDFDALSIEQKRQWRETFDKSRGNSTIHSTHFLKMFLTDIPIT